MTVSDLLAAEEKDGVGRRRQWLGLWLPRQQTLWHLAGVQVWCGGGGGSRFVLKVEYSYF